MAADFVFAPTPRLAQGAGRRIFSLRRDKKNSARHLRLVLVNADGEIGLVDVEPEGALVTLASGR